MITDYLPDIDPDFEAFMAEKYGVEDIDYAMRMVRASPILVYITVYGPDQLDILTYNTKEAVWSYVN